MKYAATAPDGGPEPKHLNCALKENHTVGPIVVRLNALMTFQPEIWREIPDAGLWLADALH
jgi:hypothetical protein